jgi:hypothetical protein
MIYTKKWSYLFCELEFKFNFLKKTNKGESPPKIVNLKPHNSTVLVRGNAIFECHVFSFPLARISWKKNNKKLNEHNKKYKILHGSNVSFLRITDASHTHNGVLRITCVAENHFGIVEATASLNVISGMNLLNRNTKTQFRNFEKESFFFLIIKEREKPKQFPIAQISYPKSVEPNSLFRIECNVTGEQPVNIQWYQSNKPVFFDNQNYYTNWTSSDQRIKKIYILQKY